MEPTVFENYHAVGTILNDSLSPFVSSFFFCDDMIMTLIQQKLQYLDWTIIFLNTQLRVDYMHLVDGLYNVVFDAIKVCLMLWQWSIYINVLVSSALYAISIDTIYVLIKLNKIFVLLYLLILCIYKL